MSRAKSQARTRAKSLDKSLAKSLASHGDQTVRVALRERSYEVRIGSGAIDRMGGFLKEAPSKRAFIIADARLNEARARVLAALKRAGWQVHEIPVDAGESFKEFERLYPLYGELLKAKADRSSTLFALGGGSIGDAAGFVASTYLRGLRWVGLPTTLLAQVDSSVGGKTAVNHEAGKNLIGTFHQPSLVVCETDFLETLSKREVISGLGEIVKYGLIYDPKFYEYVRTNWKSALELDRGVLARMIKTSLAWKAKAVSRDEFDRKGVREVLNFGHTFGHALESVTRYQSFQHGEAVLWGMRFALALSRVRRKLAARDWRETDEFLRGIDLPPLPTDVSPQEYFVPMTKDKKAHEGRVRFVLLQGIGKSVSDRNVTEKDLLQAFEMMGGANAR